MPSHNGKHRYRLIAAFNHLRSAMQQVENGDPGTMHVSCLNCDSFDEQNEVCTRYRQRPPARVIAFGCPDWVNLNDDVPF